VHEFRRKWGADERRDVQRSPEFARVTFALGGLPIALRKGVRIFEVDPGRWRVEWGSGLGLEVVLLFSRTVAFWRWGGELFAEVPIGEA
jgi:hypothetical protein